MPNSIDELFDLVPGDRPQQHKAVTADNISNELCAELLETIDVGDYPLTDWDIDFIGDNLGRTSFSPKQRAVIYKLAFKLKLL